MNSSSILAQRGARFTAFPKRHTAQLGRRSVVVLSAAQKNGSDLEKKWNDFVRQAKPKVDGFVEDAKDAAQRTYVRLDSEYDISARAEKAAKRVKETAKDVDQQYGVRRRFRSLTQQLQKDWPVWSRKFDEFAATPVGKVTVIAALLLLISTPLFWRIVNTLFLLWWLALPIATMLISQAQVRQAQQAAAEEEERRRNPFASMFKGAGFGAQGPRTPQQTKQSRGQYSGPIIEAEWQPLDDKKK